MTDHAERAVEVLERALAAVGDANPTLALRLEAAIAGAGMVNERYGGGRVASCRGLARSPEGTAGPAGATPRDAGSPRSAG